MISINIHMISTKLESNLEEKKIYPSKLLATVSTFYLPVFVVLLYILSYFSIWNLYLMTNAETVC